MFELIEMRYALIWLEKKSKKKTVAAWNVRMFAQVDRTNVRSSHVQIFQTRTQLVLQFLTIFENVVPAMKHLSQIEKFHEIQHVHFFSHIYGGFAVCKYTIGVDGRCWRVFVGYVWVCLLEFYIRLYEKNGKKKDLKNRRNCIEKEQWRDTMKIIFR